MIDLTEEECVLVQAAVRLGAPLTFRYLGVRSWLPFAQPAPREEDVWEVSVLGLCFAYYYRWMAAVLDPVLLLGGIDLRGRVNVVAANNFYWLPCEVGQEREVAW